MADKQVIVQIEYDTDEAQKNIDNLAVKMDGLKESNKKYNAEVKSARSDLKKTDDQLKAEGKTREQLAKNIQNGTVKISRNKDAMTKASKQRKQAIKDITGEQSAFDKLNSNLEANTKAQNKSTGALNAMPGATGGAIKGIMGMVKAALLFIATPLGAVIAAIVLGLKALMSYFKGSEEGQNKLNKIMAVGSAVIGNLGDTFRDFGSLVFESLKVLGARFTKFFANIGLGWQKVKGVFKDNTAAIEEQKNKIAEADKILTKRKEERKAAADELKNGIKGIIEETKKEVGIAKELADRQAALDLLQRSFLVKRAKLESEIAEARAKAADTESYSAAERVKFLQEAIDKENEIMAVNQKIAQEKYELKKIQNTLSDSTKEDLNEEAALEAELFNVQKANSLKRVRITGQLVTAKKELKAEAAKAAAAEAKIEAEAAAKEEAAQQAELERRAAAIAAMAKMERDRIESEISTFEERKKLMIKQADEELALKLDQKGILNEEIELAEAEHKAKLAGIDADYNAKIAATKEEDLQNAYDSMQQIIAATNGMADERITVISDAFAKISTINWDEVEDTKEAFIAIAGAASGLTSLITAGHETETANLEEEQAYQLSLVEGNTEATAAVNEKYAKESAKLKTQQAKDDKTAAIIDATIATALGVVSALATSGSPILGIVMAALVGVLGGVQIAAIASQPTPKFSYAKGGAIVNGPSHAQGGVDVSGSNGQYFGNVQGDEAMFVMKKDATAEIAAMSAINENHGGRSFFTRKTGSFADGGQMEGADISSAVQTELQRAKIMVDVGSIETGMTERNNVTEVGVVS